MLASKKPTKAGLPDLIIPGIPGRSSLVYPKLGSETSFVLRFVADNLSFRNAAAFS